MINRPILYTLRLVLSSPTIDDLQELLYHLNQTADFSDNTLTMPYPYTEESAKNWFRIIDDGLEQQNGFIFGIREKENLRLTGAIGLHIDIQHKKAEVGYWIGKDFWNRGYVSEALLEAISYGFKNLKLNKIFASHYPHNPASGRVLKKCGMHYEGLLRQEIFKNGKFLDLHRYSITADQFILT